MLDLLILSLPVSSSLFNFVVAVYWEVPPIINSVFRLSDLFNSFWGLEY